MSQNCVIRVVICRPKCVRVKGDLRTEVGDQLVRRVGRSFGHVVTDVDMRNLFVETY